VIQRRPPQRREALVITGASSGIGAAFARELAAPRVCWSGASKAALLSYGLALREAVREQGVNVGPFLGAHVKIT